MRHASRVPHLLGLVALLMSALALPMVATAQTPTCADYSSQAAAQFALDINPSLASSLDPDGNGVACDHEGAGAPTPSSTELQLPTEQAGDAPATSAQAQPTTGSQQPTADVIDGQPTQPSTQPQTPPQGGDLDGRIGGTRASIEAAHGQPVEENPSESNPNVTGVGYAGSGPISNLFIVYASDQAIIIWLSPSQPWTSEEASGILTGFLPTDVTTLPQPEQLADGSLMMPVNSQILAGGITQQAMTDAAIPGVPGDLYLRLVPEGGLVVDVEIGVGNGDNVREDINDEANSGGQTVTTTPVATTTTQVTTPTPVAGTGGTTTDATAFLQQARAEVDQYQAEIAELRAILGQESFSEADTTRLTTIVIGWMAIDTTPITAPPEHAAIADQLTSIHADLSNAGGIIFLVLSSNDTSRVQEAADAINRADQTLSTLDQQLTGLGV